ncbi:hypothetical protein NB231_10093 [Nitrococcus mobilis Nb-231]|uniref:Uncharacterized protein n=1 Tax=Nitrococcus mobilis Nb-231 TaxID=314278 RepID=A4BNJ6_9GAMM|nr:hypothetical protein NB231_10093 [Nitrococcus mobilis Nb-231]
MLAYPATAPIGAVLQQDAGARVSGFAGSLRMDRAVEREP